MASGSTQPFCHNTLSGQTDQYTHRHTHKHRPIDGIGDRSVRTARMLAILVKCDALANTVNMHGRNILLDKD